MDPDPDFSDPDPDFFPIWIRIFSLSFDPDSKKPDPDKRTQIWNTALITVLVCQVSPKHR